MKKALFASLVLALVLSSARADNPVAVAPTSVLVPAIAGPAASYLVAKAGPGTLYGGYVVSSATGYVLVLNQATTPTNGSLTAFPGGTLVECIPAPVANQAYGINFGIGPGERFPAGITIAFSATGCGTLTLSATAFIKASVY